MGSYRLLDQCERLEAVEACDVHRFRQFFEIERLDKKGRRRKAIYTGKGLALKQRFSATPAGKYSDRITRVADLATRFKNDGISISSLYALALHEQTLGLPMSGRKANTAADRLAFIRGLDDQRTTPPVMVGAAAGRLGQVLRPLPTRPGTGIPANIVDVLTRLVAQIPIIAVPATTEPVDQVIWAVGIDYSQEWCGRGYGRGRLIRSIPLTPNETMQVVTKTWNKRTERRQDVQSSENDVSTEFIGDEKWTLATRKELTASMNGSVNGNVQQHSEISLPLEVVDVSLGGSQGLGGTLGGSLTQTIAETTERVTQETVKAANRLKTTVTSTVETVADVGIETTQTQTISNPNRCHSLTYHFFEIAETYRVRTKPVLAAPYLLVPLDRPAITFDWLLCHECELKALLPCDTFYEGFKAAKLLKAREHLGQFLGSLDTPAITEAADGALSLLDDLVTTYLKLSNAGVLPDAEEARGTVMGAVLTLVNAAALALRDPQRNGQDAVETLFDTGEQVFDVIVAGAGNVLGVRAMALPSGARALVRGDGGGGAGSFVYWEIVKIVAPEIERALAALAEAVATISAMAAGPAKTRAAVDALNAFFAAAGDIQAAFDKVNRVAAVITFAAPVPVVVAGFLALGLPGAAIAALAALMAVGTAAVSDGTDATDLLPDDEGLEALVLRGKGQLQSLASLALLPAAPGSDASKEEQARYDRALQEMKREQLEAAYARVEFDRLKCHLDDNFEYYNQLLWSRKPASAIQGQLALYGIPLHLVDQQVAGFARNRAAFRVREAMLTGDFDWKKEYARLKLDDLFARSAVETEIEMPTPGMTVEPALGQCCACDEFVAGHRKLDLRNREAEVVAAEGKAVQEQQEAERLKERIKAGDFSDPTPFESPQSRVIVDPQGT